MIWYIHNRFLSALPAWKDDIVWAARIFQKLSVSFYFYGFHIILWSDLWLWGFILLFLDQLIFDIQMHVRCIQMQCAMAHESLGHSGRIRIIKNHFIFDKISFILNSNGRDSLRDLNSIIKTKKNHDSYCKFTFTRNINALHSV